MLSYLREVWRGQSCSAVHQKSLWPSAVHKEERTGHLKPVVGPAAKLHLTVLVVEGEPGDVDLAGGHEDAGGDVGAEAVAGHHHVGWVGSIEQFAGTAHGNIALGQIPPAKAH